MTKRNMTPSKKLRDWLKIQGVSNGDLVKALRKLDPGLKMSPAQLSRILNKRTDPTVPQRLALEIATGITATDWDSVVERRLRRQLNGESEGVAA